MKEIVCFSLLLFASSTFQQNDTEYGICTHHQTSAYCDVPVNGNVLPNDIPLNITKLTMNSLSPNQGTKLWLLTKFDSFTRFPNLQELSISGEFIFSPNLTNAIGDLKRQLFNITTLSRLIILSSKNWTFVGGGGTGLWTPPPNLKAMETNNLPPGRFDWRTVTSLQIVKMKQRVNWTEMFEFLNPSARSLKEINVPNNYFKINNIASFCHLTEYTFDSDALRKNTSYCECQKYLEWQKFLADEENVTLTYNNNSKLVCSQNTGKLNCSSYNLNKAKMNRVKCLTWPNTTTAKPVRADKSQSSFWGKLWSWVMNLPTYALIIIGVLIFFSVIVGTVLVVNMMRNEDDEYYETELEMEMELEY